MPHTAEAVPAASSNGNLTGKVGMRSIVLRRHLLEFQGGPAGDHLLIVSPECPGHLLGIQITVRLADDFLTLQVEQSLEPAVNQQITPLDIQRMGRFAIQRAGARGSSPHASQSAQRLLDAAALT